MLILARRYGQSDDSGSRTSLQRAGGYHGFCFIMNSLSESWLRSDSQAQCNMIIRMTLVSTDGSLNAGLHAHKWLAKLEQIPLPVELARNRKYHVDGRPHIHPCTLPDGLFGGDAFLLSGRGIKLGQ